jgi:hypothetical protein
MKKPAAHCKSCLSVCLCLSGLSALTTPRWLDGVGLNLVGVFRKGGNRFCTNFFLKCAFNNLRFFLFFCEFRPFAEPRLHAEQLCRPGIPPKKASFGC